MPCYLLLGLMIAGTDTRQYIHLTNNIYMFSPSFFFPEDTARFHGLNERISVENYEQAVNFYYHLIKNSDSDNLEPRHEHGNEL